MAMNYAKPRAKRALDPADPYRDDTIAPADPYAPAPPMPVSGEQPPEPVIGDIPPEAYTNAPLAPAADPWRSGLNAGRQEGYRRDLRDDEYDYFTRRRAEENAVGNVRPDEWWFDAARGHGAGGSDTALYGRYAGRDFDRENAPPPVPSAWTNLSLPPIVADTPQATTAAPTALEAPYTGPGPDPFTAMGGGVLVNGGWVPRDHPLAAQATAQPPTGGANPLPTGPAPGGATNGPPAGLPALPEAPVIPGTNGPTQAMLSEEARRAILALLQQEPITAESLQGTPEAAAYRLGGQRSQERQRAQLAEDASRGGFTGTSEFETRARGLEQQRGEGEAQFMGNLAAQRLSQQRDEILQGINAAMAAGENEAARALQLQLARMDDAIRRAQLSQQDRQFTSGQAQQESQFGRNLSQNDRQFLQQLAEQAGQFRAGLSQSGRQFDASNALAGELGRGNLGLNWAQLNQQGNQFNNTLGFNYTQLQQNANRDALLAILGLA